MNLFEWCSRVIGPILAALFLVGYITVGLALMLLASQADTPEKAPLMYTCFVKEETFTILGVADVTINGHRYMGMGGDRNEDGRLDILLLYEVDEHGGPHSFPRYYSIDDDNDMKPDRLYEDLKQEGQCSDMVDIGKNYFKRQAKKEVPA